MFQRREKSCSHEKKWCFNGVSTVGKKTIFDGKKKDVSTDF